MSNDLFKCQQCSQLYDIPKSLPCGNTICFSCLNSKSEFNCPFCNEKHETPQNGFPTNIILQQLMNLNMKPIVETKPTATVDNELNEIDKNLKLLSERKTNSIRNHFDTIRSEIINRSEFLITRLDELRETMLNDVDFYESQLIENSIKTDHDEKFHELQCKLNSDNSNNDALLITAKDLNCSIKTDIDNLNVINLINKDSFQYELSTANLDSSIICKLRLDDLLKFERMNNKINTYKTINYKTNDTQLLYDYKYFVSTLQNQKIVIGLNVKLKSTIKSQISLNGPNYKLKIILFDHEGHLLNELPFDHEINQTFKQLEYLTSFKNLIYCIYIDSNLQYCLKIFDETFKLVKEMKFNSIIKSITISDKCQIYALFNILNVSAFDLNFEKLNTFGQLIDESEPFYMDSVKEIFIKNKRIYLRHNNDKLIKILDESNGCLVKLTSINMENCLIQINKFSKIVSVNRLKKVLSIYDENGYLLCENELVGIQNVSSFYITNDDLYVINDFPNRCVYVF